MYRIVPVPVFSVIFKRTKILISIPIYSRAVDPHSFYADPEPAVFPNADPDPGPEKKIIKVRIYREE